MKVRWHWQAWRDLDPDTLHAFLKLRSDVFVVEQNCVYADIDGLDPRCEHLSGFDASGRVVAYLRLLQPGAKSPEPSIGRVVVARDARKGGLGRALMVEGMKRCAERYPGSDVFIAAQQYLQRFYASLGFEAIGDAYLEDGILHVNMRWSETRVA